MKNLTSLVLCILLTACVAAPVQEKPLQLFEDAVFSAPSESIEPNDIFALSEDMQHYLDHDIARKIRTDGKIMALVNALYTTGQLKLSYDATKTLNAAEAFRARSGNCLSLTVMTAAFARQMGLSIQFHRVMIDEVWDRHDNIESLIGHVNLTIEQTGDPSVVGGHAVSETVDFGALGDIRSELMEDIGEDTIVAMYMNNRATELIAQDDLNNAYWWARAAMEYAPALLSAYNTLGVIYYRHHNLPQAERVLRHVLEREPDNVLAMANQIQVLSALGRNNEAQLLAHRLAEIQPNPPYFFFNRGMEAMRAGDYRSAKNQFTKEVNRASYSHQFHFWLALADYGLGDMSEAIKQLDIAIDISPHGKQHDSYVTQRENIRLHDVNWIVEHLIQ